MKHSKHLHYIFLTLTIIWMAVIFIFSSQNGEASSSTSNSFADFIVSVFIPNLKEYDITRQQDILDTITFIIRKGAHFTEYAILGVLSFSTVITYIWKKFETDSADSHLTILRSKRLIYGFGSLIFSCLYAISDELHQGFVADRSPSVRDVCIDTCGALAGIVFICFILSLNLKKKTH